MFAKLANPRFLLDMRPLLPAAQAEALTDRSTAVSFRRVFTALVDLLRGEPRGRDAVPFTQGVPESTASSVVMVARARARRDWPLRTSSFIGRTSTETSFTQAVSASG